MRSKIGRDYRSVASLTYFTCPLWTGHCYIMHIAHLDDLLFSNVSFQMCGFPHLFYPSTHSYTVFVSVLHTFLCNIMHSAQFFPLNINISYRLYIYKLYTLHCIVRAQLLEQITMAWFPSPVRSYCPAHLTLAYLTPTYVLK